MDDDTLERAAEGLGLDLPHLTAARELSLRTVEEARSALREVVPAESGDADVVALGSLARQEASERSDVDFLVVMDTLPADVRLGRKLIDATHDVRQVLDLAPAGATGMFERVVAAPDLTEFIGLEDDTNISHSLRILTLEESVSIYLPDLHARLLEAIIKRYLDDAGKSRAPRFLLNDVVRYWRTLAVDYQAKRWKSVQPGGWGLRYLKLIISRKLTFAGMLVALFLVDQPSEKALIKQIRLPSLSRLAQLHELLDDTLLDHLRGILLIADAFVEKLGDKEFREASKSIESIGDIQPGSPFADMVDRAKELQIHLERIFFDSTLLGAKTRHYLSF